MTSLITSLSWVPRGHAAAFPTKYSLDEEEYSRIAKSLKLSLEDAKEDLEQAQGAAENGDELQDGSANEIVEDEDEDNHETANDESEEEDSEEELDADEPKRVDTMVRREGETEDEFINRQYNMDDYSDDENEEGEPDKSIFGTVKSLAYHANGEEDPYITLPEGEASDDDEREELQIMPTDNLVLAARVEDEIAHLEVYVYEDDSDNLYVHHDVMLPAIPLAVEWVGRTTLATKSDNATANYAAIATMDPDIEIWDLDVVDSMYPSAILGQASAADAAANGAVAPKKTKKKSKKANDAYHVDSVLTLASNPNHRNLLASGSADKTVKLWDLSTCTAASSYSQHTDKVCALAWHPTQNSVFLSGSYDRTVIACDARAPNAKGPQWGVESDVEQISCDPHNEHMFYVSTESGVLHAFDARTLPASPEQSKAIWRLQAHDNALSSFSVNPAIPGFIATGSQDRTVKLWDVQEGEGKGPSLITSRDLGVGKVFSLGFAPDPEVAFRLAAAGSKGSVQVWDTSTNKAVRSAFATRVGKARMAEEGSADKLVSVAADESDEEDDEGGEEMDQD